MLRKLQGNFLNSFLDKKQESSFIISFLGPDQMTGFHVYKQAVFARLSAALSEAYPVCETLVGKQCFRGMAYRYVEGNPSHSPSLFDYGDSFPEFIATLPALSELPYLPDLCRLEWACHRAFYAEHTAPFDYAALREVKDSEQANLCFQLPPSACLIQSEHPIYQIWEAHQSNEESLETLLLEPVSVRLMIWRQDYQLRFDCLTEIEYVFLNSVSEGKTLGEWTRQYQEGDDLEGLPELLSSIIAKGWVGGFYQTANIE